VAFLDLLAGAALPGFVGEVPWVVSSTPLSWSPSEKRINYFSGEKLFDKA
jgi:hypothetical protein